MIQIIIIFSIYSVAQVNLLNQASKHYRVFLADYVMHSATETALNQRNERIEHMGNKFVSFFEI